MVERVNARGKYFERVREELGVDSPGEYRNLWFHDSPTGRNGLPGLERALALLSGHEDLDRRSKLIQNTRNEKGFSRLVLVVPLQTPDLLPPDDSLPKDMPDPSESHIAYVWDSSGTHRFEMFILHRRVEQVEQIARQNASNATGIDPFDFTVEAVLEEPETFISRIRERIDRGYRPPDRLLRFSDLKEYYQRHIQRADQRPERAQNQQI